MTINFGREVDLHHFHPQDTELVVTEFIRQAADKGYESLRIIHGKGRSQKKMHVYKVLERHPSVEKFGDDGANWGVTIVILKELT